MKLLYDYMPQIDFKNNILITSNKYIESSGSSSYVLKTLSNGFELKNFCFFKNIRVEYEKVKGGLFVRFTFGMSREEAAKSLGDDINKLLKEIFTDNCGSHEKQCKSIRMPCPDKPDGVPCLHQYN